MLNTFFTLLIFSLPFGVVIRMQIFPGAFIYPTDIIAFLIFIVFLSRLIKERKIVEKKLFILVGLFLLTGLVGLVINLTNLSTQQFLVSFSYLLRYMIYASLLFAVNYLNKSSITLVKSKLIVSGLIFTILGYVQYFYYPNLKNLYYLGWDEHLGRLFSTFLDPNFAGVLMALNTLLISERLLEVYRTKNKNSFYIFVAAFLISLTALFLTHSRTGWVTLLMGGVVFLLISKLYKQVLLFVMILVVGLTVFSNTKIEGLNPFRIVSAEARIESLQTAFFIFTKNPILGIGFNSYRYAQVKYGFRDDNKTQNSNADAGTDNSYLFVLATTGIAGFLILMDFWVNILKRVKVSPVVFSSVICFLISAFFINTLFYMPLLVWMSILIGVTLSRKR